MAVYREGYSAIETYNRNRTVIFNDSYDVGVPVKKGDKFWNLFTQLVEWYGEPKTKKYSKGSGLPNASCEVVLIDEWAVSDERKTMSEATETFVVEYFKNSNHSSMINKNCDGWFAIARK